MKRNILAILALILGTISVFAQPDRLLTKEELLQNRNLLGGVYCAYPVSEKWRFTPTPKGYSPFYISHYGRHGSRYQPNDSRYANTLKRLKEGHSKGALTPMGENLLGRIQILCDSCLGHGGLLTTVGARQHEAIARRMYNRFPGVFQNNGKVSARASVVKRCGQSMDAFLKGLSSEASNRKICLDIKAEVDSAYMAYIAYDSPEMKALASKSAPWQKDYDAYMRSHVDCTPIINRIFSDATGVDTLQTVIDLYWLTVGMQNLDLRFNLDDVFTPEELMSCWQCVNYRMYVCNAAAEISSGIPAHSASTLVRNIIESADEAISNLKGKGGKGVNSKEKGESHKEKGVSHKEKSECATLRFGHDSNILRLMCLMKIHNSANSISDPSEAWKIWQEGSLSPMAANLQLIFYKNKKDNVLVKILLNEHQTSIDEPSLTNINGCYPWDELRDYLLKQTSETSVPTEFVEPVQ